MTDLITQHSLFHILEVIQIGSVGQIEKHVFYYLFTSMPTVHQRILPSLKREKRTSLHGPFSFLSYIFTIQSISGIGVHRQCGGIKTVECILLAPDVLLALQSGTATNSQNVCLVSALNKRREGSRGSWFKLWLRESGGRGGINRGLKTYCSPFAMS